MKQSLPNNFILNGFDRSGTSAISRTLATHPDIELIMQPFNGGSIRDKLYLVLDEGTASPEDTGFFSKLENGVLEQSYIKSGWHAKFSSVRDFTPGKLHLIKTTQNHLTITWVTRNFPRIELWGIWRNPMEILASLVRNGFHVQWYSGAADEIKKTVSSNPLLNSTFSEFSDALTNPVRQMAYILATRTWYYFYHIDPRKIIDYKVFSDDPNKALTPVLEYFDLPAFEFRNIRDRDLNIIGKEYNPKGSYFDGLSDDDIKVSNRLFETLYSLPATGGLS